MPPENIEKTNKKIPPSNSEEMVKFIVHESPCYSKSERYALDLGGNYKEYSDLGIIVANSYGNYIVDLVELFIGCPASVSNRSNIEACIRGDFEILEILCRSKNDDVLTSVATGIFEALIDSENEIAIGAIVANLGPYARILWDSHIPGFAASQISGTEGAQIIKRKYFKANNEFRITNWNKR